MGLFELTQLIAAVCAFGVGVSVLIPRQRTIAEWSFFIGMLLLGLERVCHLLSWQADAVPYMVTCQRWSLVCLSIVPVCWLVFSITYARGNGIELLKKWLAVLLTFGGLLLGFAFLSRNNLVVDAVWTAEAGNWVFQLAWPARLLHGGVIFGVVLALMNLEWTFRAAVGTARWKIKYTVFGLGLLFGERLYTSSQAVLYSANRGQFILLDGIGLVLASLMLAFSLYRSRFSKVDIYPSAAVLQRSVTVLLVAGYLVATGLVARIVTALGRERALPVTALFILIGAVGVGVVLFSDRVRQATRAFVSRHFKRPLHDYRHVWSEFTKRTSGIFDRKVYARAVTGLISEVFEALSVTVWLHDKATGTLVFGSSTALDSEHGQIAQLNGAVTSALSGAVARAHGPIDIDASPEPWCELLRQSNPGLFKSGGHRFCMPLVARGEFEGVIVLGDRVRGTPFTAEDLELLQQLANHIAAGLQNIGLSEKVIQSRELEAFQAMSAFLVHDLKNTASTLSLTVRNMQQHLENPEFRAEAMQTLERSVAHINQLIGRLTTLRQSLRIEPVLADVNKVVTSAAQSAGNDPQVVVKLRLTPVPAVMLDTKQFESVVVNLLVNAREASAPGSEIVVETGAHDNGVFVAVSDHGCGMSEEFIANSLFKPFRTTKKNGLGIGMYQARAIVEAHRGRITVISEVGKGTTVRVWLPLAESWRYDEHETSITRR